jgi:glycosyltransferase involved in cell wall biosynthesis
VTTRIRLLFISNTYDPEPGVVHGLPLARWLSGRGYDVTVLTAIPWYPLGRFYPGYKLRPWQWEEHGGVRILRVPVYPSHDSSAVRRILTYASFFATGAVFGLPHVGEVDLVSYFDNTPTTGALAWLIARARRAPMTQHIADIWPETVTESGMLSGWKKSLVERATGAWLKALYRRNATTTVLSPGFRRMLIERGVPASRIEVVYNWADEERFFPTTPDARLKKELGLEGRFNFIYAGNIGPMQALDTAVRAMSQLRDLPSAQLVIVGGGPLEEQVRDLARSLDLGNVLFIGRRPLDEMNAINALADVLLVSLKASPFLRATIPSKTQVALACGRPVLLAVAGDAADVINSARAGLTVAPEDPVQMADAMRAFVGMTNGELDAYGRRGRAFYESELSFLVGASMRDRMFREIVGQGPWLEDSSLRSPALSL